MRKKILPFITVLMLALFVGSCSNEDVMPEIDKGATSRTITFTASMPGEDDPATRVSVAEEADRTIALTWEADDKLDLLFVQGTNKFNKSTTVTNITDAGKKASFTIVIPEGIIDGEPFNLYGVYGGGEVSTTNPELIELPAIEGTTLNEENVGKKVMLRFAKTVDATGAVGTVNFEHVGFLFTAKIKVTAGSVDDITSVQLVGADAGNETWAYNASENHFNMETGDFTAVGTGSNTVSFQNAEKDADNNVLTVRNWFPAHGAAWPALKLSINGTNETATAKPARTPEVGKAYYLYATWNGTDLVFADKDFNEPVAGTKIDIADLRETFVKGETYAEDHFIEGEVILNAEYGNANTRAAFIADGTAGISFFFAEEAVAAVPLGAKVKVNLLNATWSEFNGLRQLNMSTAGVTILETTATTPLEPRVVTIQELVDGKYQSELVQVNNVQFKDIPATYGSNPDLIDNNAIEINVYSNGGATFKDENVPEGNGPFIGVVSIYNTPQLLIRTTADLSGMTDDRYVPPFINVNPFSLTFEKEGGSETIAVTANVAWTATSDAAWATISSDSGTNDGTITVIAEANTGAEARSAVITITDDDDATTTTVNVTQAGAEEDPVTLLFPGSDFNNWSTFLSSLTSTTLKTYATESTAGGRDGSGAIHINGTPTGNDYVFTAEVPAGFSAADKTKITFWVKGTAAKSLSLNVYTTNTAYKPYNMGNASNPPIVLTPQSQNSYTGTVNTGGEWIKVSLDISTIAINTTPGEKLFALKVGRDATYNLYIDDITIE